MNVLIPMAGMGQRFVDAGYKMPKPLIDVRGKPMIERVIKSLDMPDADYIFIVQEEHIEKYDLDAYLRSIVKDPFLLAVSGPTAGAACTALLARDVINNDEPLLIANADQIVKFRSSKREWQFDGTIYTFPATHPKWSYAATDEWGMVWGIAEKQVISNSATCGIYGWTRGSDFVKYAEQMISQNLRVNNEFYIAPVYNLAINDGLLFDSEGVEEMHGLGDPESLERYVEDLTHGNYL